LRRAKEVALIAWLAGTSVLNAEVLTIVGVLARADVMPDLEAVGIADDDCLWEVTLEDEAEARSTLQVRDLGLEFGAQRLVLHSL